MVKRAAALILMSTLAGSAFAYELPCQKCHPAESKTQPLTAMSRAAFRPRDADILKEYPSLRFSSGPYRYVIARDGDRITYSVNGGGKTLSAELLWAFGDGSMGQTYLYEYRGALYESQVSFYSALKGLDLTIGHRNPAQLNLELAAGRRLDQLEIKRCLSCHTTGTTPGVKCEHCHENSESHSRSFSSGPQASIPAKLSQLGNEEVSDFCGQCHRTWQDVEANGPHNINNVRFQPYRIATSKCYIGSIRDKRISCVACHDPHQPVVRDADYYDVKCRGCHTQSVSGKVKTCKVGQQGCVRCHMPKVDFPGGHFKFTDHRIRIVRGDSYPG